MQGAKQSVATADLALLRQLLIAHFNTGELQSLCFDLGIDYESLPGQGKADKARDLAAYVTRHGQIARLLTECQKLRPNGDWFAVTQMASSTRSPDAAVPPPASPEPQPPMVLRVGLAVAGLLISILWLIVQPGFEPVIGFLGASSIGVGLLAYRKQVWWWAVGGGIGLCLLAGLIYVFGTLAAAPATVNVVVRVADDDNNPVGQAGITLLYQGSNTETLRTDDRGIVLLPNISASSQATLVAEAKGYQVNEETVDISQDTTLRVTLERRDSNLRALLVRVVAAERFEPIVNAQIVLIVGADTFSATTDSNGLARFAVPFDAPALQADLTVSANGKEARNQNITLLPDQLQEVRLDTLNETLEVGAP